MISYFLQSMKNVLNQALLFVITLNKVDFQKSRELLRDQRRATPTREFEKNKDTSLEMARLSPFVPFGLVLAFQAWLWPFWPVFGLSDTLYNLTICEKDVICVQPSNCQHGLCQGEFFFLLFFVFSLTYCYRVFFFFSLSGISLITFLCYVLYVNFVIVCYLALF